MKKEKREELEKGQQWQKEMGRREKQLLEEIGESVDADLVSKHREEQELDTLFDRLTPAERLELYQTNPEQWQKLLEAKEAAGMRKLLSW